MECHRCPHRDEVEAGKYRQVPFEQTPCGQCELHESSEYTIAFDEERPPTEEQLVEDVHFAEEVPEVDDSLPISVMEDALIELMCMPRGVRDVICWRFAGMAYKDIALAQGLTVAGVENRHRRAMLRWPALRALFALKTAKQKRRKPHGGQK